jgi:hypothetical protein
MCGPFCSVPEQEQSGPAEQKFGQRNAHLPPARERFGRLPEVRLRETKSLEDLRDPQLDAVALLATVELGQIVVAHEQPFVCAIGEARIGQGVFDMVHLCLGLEQRLERERRFIEQ